MNPGNEIVKELEELASPLANMPRTTPFTVPEEYFNTLNEALKEALTYEEEPTLTLPKETPFALPQGYFEGFAASLIDKVAEAPAFGEIAGAGFEVPAGYFEGLPQQILQAAKAADSITSAAPQQKQAKVISFFPQKAIRWAAAAGLILAIGLGGYKMIGNSPQRAVSTEIQLAQLDKAVISSYVQQHIDEFDTEMLAEASPVLNQPAEKNIDQLKQADISKYLDDEGI